jgi:hypothetical protein
MSLLSPEEMAIFLHQTTPDNSDEKSLIIILNFIINVRGK